MTKRSGRRCRKQAARRPADGRNAGETVQHAGALGLRDELGSGARPARLQWPARPRCIGGPPGCALGAEQVILPGLGVAPPLTEWGGKEIAIDAWHHVTYAAATGAAYEALNRMR